MDINCVVNCRLCCDPCIQAINSSSRFGPSFNLVYIYINSRVFILTIVGVILLFSVVDIYRLYIHNSIFKSEIQNVLIQINDDTVNPSEIEQLLHTNLEESWLMREYNYNYIHRAKYLYHNINYHLYIDPLPHEPRIFKLIPCFSIVRSTKRIFNLNTEKNQLNCLHSLRFLSLSWIILGHSFGFILFFSGTAF